MNTNLIGQGTFSRKQKGVSPLEANFTHKRQCEGSSKYEQNIKSPQSDPPLHEELRPLDHHR